MSGKVLAGDRRLNFLERLLNEGTIFKRIDRSEGTSMEGRGAQGSCPHHRACGKSCPPRRMPSLWKELSPWKDNHCPPACSPSSSDSQGGESQRLSKGKAGQAWVEAAKGPSPPQVQTQWREEGPDKDRVKDRPRSGGAEVPGCPQ